MTRSLAPISKGVTGFRFIIFPRVPPILGGYATGVKNTNPCVAISKADWISLYNNPMGMSKIPNMVPNKSSPNRGMGSKAAVQPT